MTQSTLLQWADARPSAKSMGETLRMNAEAMLEELGAMPSCKGFWPRILPEVTRGCIVSGPYDCFDARYEQCRAGIYHKHIDVTTGEVLDVLHAWSDRGRGHRMKLYRDERITDAGIDGDILTVTTERAAYEWTLRDPDERGCWRNDRVMPFEPTECPEHTLILALSRGMLGPDLALLVDLPCRWAITSREGRPGLQSVIDRIESELGIHVDEPRDAPEEDYHERIRRLLEGTDESCCRVLIDARRAPRAHQARPRRRRVAHGVRAGRGHVLSARRSHGRSPLHAEGRDGRGVHPTVQDGEHPAHTVPPQGGARR